MCLPLNSNDADTGDDDHKKVGQKMLIHIFTLYWRGMKMRTKWQSPSDVNSDNDDFDFDACKVLVHCW